MGIITGYFCLLCFCILSAKALTHKFHFAKADSILMRIHKPVCAVLLTVCVLHIILVYPVFKTRRPLVWITGIFTVAAFILITMLCHMIREKRRSLTLHRVLSLVMLCCITGHILIYFVDYKSYQTKIHDIQIEDVTISDMRDGIYTGTYDAGYIYAKAAITVRDGRIVHISLLQHDNERGASAEKITDKIIAEQQLDVDAVSGATNSSKVIKKAIENALKGS